MFYTTLRKAASALLLLGSLGLAQASFALTAPTFDFGSLAGTASYTKQEMAPSFDDIYKFKLATGSSAVLGGIFGNADDSTVNFNLQASSNGSSWSPMGSLALTPDSNGSFSFAQTFSGLTAGATYWFRLSGVSTGGTYTVTLAPVPEPETFAMLLAGLGLMGVVARRRNATTHRAGV